MIAHFFQHTESKFQTNRWSILGYGGALLSHSPTGELHCSPMGGDHLPSHGPDTCLHWIYSTYYGGTNSELLIDD